MTYQMQAGMYLVTFKTETDFVHFRKRTLLFMEMLPDMEAFSAVYRMARQYYARPVIHNAIELSDINPVPYGLWCWMRQNWDMSMLESV